MKAKILISTFVFAGAFTIFVGAHKHKQHKHECELVCVQKKVCKAKKCDHKKVCAKKCHKKR